MTDRLTTRELLARLQRHYIKPGAPLPGGIFLPEVGWNGGYGGGCDAIYVGFTSSSGRLLVGHELKVSRADWLNELNKPGKADPWADQCHQWWLVVNDPAIVHDGELPAGWGLMSPGRSKTRMQIHTAADTKQGHTPSWVAVRSIMARQDTLRAQAITNGLRDEREKMRREVDKQVEQRVAARSGPDTAELAQRLKAVETALGGPIDWTDNNYTRHGYIDLDLLAELGAAVRAVGSVRAVVDSITRGYGNPTKIVRQQLERLDKALADLAKAPDTPAGAEQAAAAEALW